MRISLRMSKRCPAGVQFFHAAHRRRLLPNKSYSLRPGDMARQSVVTPDPSLWRNSQSGLVTVRTRDFAMPRGLGEHLSIYVFVRQLGRHGTEVSG